jgi:hypothetical protein
MKATLLLCAILFFGSALHAEPMKTTPNGPPAAQQNGRKTFPNKAARGRSQTLTRDYRGWGAYCWFPGFNSYGYYSTANRLWYYWYAPFNRFLPVRYIGMYPPTGVGPVAGTAVAGVPPGAAPIAAGTGAAPALPAGAVAVPGAANATPAPMPAPTSDVPTTTTPEN